MSRSGRFVAIRQRNGLDLVDALGTAPRKSLLLDGVLDFDMIGQTLWVARDHALHRFALTDGQPIGEPIEQPLEHGHLVRAGGERANSALWLGYRRLLLQDLEGTFKSEDVTSEADAAAFVTLLGGRRLLVAQGNALRLRDVGRTSNVLEANLPKEGRVVGGSYLFGGRAIAVLMEGETQDRFIVLRPNGSLVHNVPIRKSRLCAVADARGLAVVLDPEENTLVSMDLRYGKMIAKAPAPLPVEDIAIDSDGKYITLGGFQPQEADEELERAATDGASSDGAPGTSPKDGETGDGGDGGDPGNTGNDDDEPDIPLSVLHIPYTDLFGGGGLLAPRRRAQKRGGAGKSPDGAGRRELAQSLELTDRPRPVDAAAQVDDVPDLPEEEEPEEPEEPKEIIRGPLLGLGRLVTPPKARAPAGARPYGSPREHLDELLDLVAARTARAIAHAWNTGRLSLPSEDIRPFEREVQALVGHKQTLAPDALAQAEERLAQLTAIAGRRALASLAAGQSLPFVNIAREFDLSTTEAQVLLVAAAPALRGEIARLYGVLANDENRPICDRYLVELILGGEDRATRDAVARSMTSDATLVKYGLVRIGVTPADQYLFAPVSVDPILLTRLRGNRFGGTGPTDISTIRWSDCSLEDLIMPHDLKADITVELQEVPRDGKPHRILVRGRLGSGRRSMAAALAARVNKPIASIDCERLPRTGRAFAESLRTELRRAGLRGAIACVSGLEVFDSTDSEGLEHVRAVFRAEPAPLFIRTSPEFQPPLEPGYLSYVIPPLGETERFEFWRMALERRGLAMEGAERLASRFRIGPGTIETIISGVEMRLSQEERSFEDISDRLDAAARQHISIRMSNVATHVERKARWEQVALPDDVLDSIREFIGRVRHRRTVYDTWGYDARMSTSRGLTALFYGPPGTGKSMVAGLIARELGLDLYRVDLARITSKWIGETEKNLAEVFDAGEDGQCVILFDEADSLFAKRTEVKSSVDRYANLEVNYLLQRLDTFEGVAILTTNLEGSIDNAFKRRMSLRLAFPFPDEEMRVRLWSAHIPPELPTAGEFDFADLAKRFPMSGGYIRNSALRAAFLAAQETQSVSQEHLERAIHLEYREMGKLSPGGRME